MDRCLGCDTALPSAARFCPICGIVVEREDDATLAMSIPPVPPGLDQLAPGQALLVVRSGPTSGSTIVLDAPEVSVGRVPEAGVFLDDVTVSRKHATFVQTKTGYRVLDGGSLNGTYVNRKRVDDADLSPGDEIQIGRFRLSYHEAPSA